MYVYTIYESKTRGSKLMSYTITCEHCDGEGQLPFAIDLPGQYIVQECSECNGSGQIEVEEEEEEE